MRVSDVVGDTEYDTDRVFVAVTENVCVNDGVVVDDAVTDGDIDGQTVADVRGNTSNKQFDTNDEDGKPARAVGTVPFR